jgi:hypothetical protein
MRHLLLALLAICFYSAAIAQDDTIGFWQVQYNGKEVSPVSLNNEHTYLLASISDTDRVNVFYYTESPCSKCLCKLELRNENGIAVKTWERKGYGDTRPFPLLGKDIGPLLKKGRVYMYFSGKYDGWLPWVFLGALRLKNP